MAYFGVRIVETLSRTVIVDADTFEEGVQKVNDAYRRSEVILDADDFNEVEFEESATFGTKEVPADDPNIQLFTILEV